MMWPNLFETIDKLGKEAMFDMKNRPGMGLVNFWYYWDTWVTDIWVLRTGRCEYRPQEEQNWVPPQSGMVGGSWGQVCQERT